MTLIATANDEAPSLTVTSHVPGARAVAANDAFVVPVPLGVTVAIPLQAVVSNVIAPPDAVTAYVPVPPGYVRDSVVFDALNVGTSRRRP